MVLHQVVPTTFFATFLNAPCTSLRLARAGPDSSIYLVVGKSNGETIFFPIDRNECISMFENEAQVAISAIAAGDLRNLGLAELVTITANGNLTSLSFPCGAPIGPVRLFSQQLYANICSAELLDMDGDGLVELVVVMTDRVVRSYRFVEELSRLVPLNKWEMPAHISGWSIGTDASSSNFALLSQSEQLHYIHLDFGPNKQVLVLQTPQLQQQNRHSSSGGQSPAVIQSNQQQQPKPPSPFQPALPLTQLVIPKRLHTAQMFQCMVHRILMVDDVSQQSELVNPCGGADVACCSAAIFHTGLKTIVTLDPWGQLNVYAWKDDDELDHARQPIATCRVMRDVDHICSCPVGPDPSVTVNNNSSDGDRTMNLLVGIVNIFNRVAILSIDIARCLM